MTWHDKKFRRRSRAGSRLIVLPEDLFVRLSREADKQDLGLQPFTILLLERALSEQHVEPPTA